MDKTCNKCGLTKPRKSFHKDPRNKCGLRGQCKDCRSYLKRDYRSNPDVVDRENYKRRVNKNDKGYRWVNLKDRYGITRENFEFILESQGGVCAICEEYHNRFHVDHCHKTGKVRGILCPNCNTALGRLGDNLTGIMKAVRYLEAFESE